MKKIVDFLTTNQTVFLATHDETQPRVRPFGFMFAQEKELFFCTANTKDVYTQLMQYPRVEIAGMDENMNTLRVTGTVEFHSDKKIKEMIFELSPLVKSIYKDPDNPIFEVFSLKVENAHFMDLMKQSHEKYSL